MRKEGPVKNDPRAQDLGKNFHFSRELDNEHLLMIYEDDIERAAAIFKIFVDGIEKEINQLRVTLENQNETEFVRLVHKMAPNFSMVGLTQATHELFEIEREGKSSGLSTRLQEKFSHFLDRLGIRLELVKQELERINQNIKG